MKQTSTHIQAASLIRGALERADISPVVMEIEALGGRVYLAAGAVRDAIRSSICPTQPYLPRDFDLAIDRLDQRSFAHVLTRHGAHPNRYGGFRGGFSGHQADFWRLEQTTGIVQHGVRATLPNMLRTFVLNVNAAAFEFHTGRFHDLGSEEAIFSGILDLLPNALLHDEATFAAKALILATLFNSRLAPGLAEFVLKHHSDPALRHEAAKARLPVETALTIRDQCAEDYFHHERAHRPHDVRRRLPNSQ